MKRFEIGQRIRDNGVTFEITGRTEKTVNFIEIKHEGRENERRSEEKKAKIGKWSKREIFITGYRTIEAN